MASKIFSVIEIDAIGEIMNISLGASATAISTMLDTRVDITTPQVKVVAKSEFSFSNLQPAVGVEITYVTGLDGKNVMLLKRHDVKVIIELLMGMEIPDEEFELDEMNISAICEVMNQMMGASSTALSEFLGRVVNISTPKSFEIADETEFKNLYFDQDEEKVVVDFLLTIDGRMKSEFVNVMSIDLAKELVEGFLPEDSKTVEEPEAAPVQNNPVPEPVTVPVQPDMTAVPPMAAAPEMPVDPMQQMYQSAGMGQPPMMQQPMAGMNQPAMQSQMAPPPMYNDTLFAQQQMMMQQMMQQIQNLQTQLCQPQAQPARTPDQKMIAAPPIKHPEVYGGLELGDEQTENLELVMGVPLEVSVEIGRTQSLVKDILEYTKGTLVVLNKQAGDQVDLFVNGQCIAKGDVVVVDDNFGIRITEVLKRPEMG